MNVETINRFHSALNSVLVDALGITKPNERLEYALFALEDDNERKCQSKFLIANRLKSTWHLDLIPSPAVELHIHHELRNVIENR
ncbi:hypothetical protein Ciccas_005797 [Cichlidogyrus casuarinus]|uniref:Uncharacterized protein n=1 Tax=Cichlidogyrus casuarinus TaxID=1844966 RepID=A0ABD2Q7L8_9PLAT